MNILIFQSCLILLSVDLPSHCLPLTMKEEGRERKEETASKREGGCWRRGTWKRTGKTASCTISHSSLCDHNCQLGRKKRWGAWVSERMSACMVKVVGGFLLLVFVVWGAREAGLQDNTGVKNLFTLYENLFVCLVFRLWFSSRRVEIKIIKIQFQRSSQTGVGKCELGNCPWVFWPTDPVSASAEGGAFYIYQRGTLSLSPGFSSLFLMLIHYLLLFVLLRCVVCLFVFPFCSSTLMGNTNLLSVYSTTQK